MNNVPRPSRKELKQFPLLSGLGATDTEGVLDRAKVVQINRGEQLFRRGDPARHIWLCRSGQLKLFRLFDSGQEKIVAIINPGRSFAEATLFMPQRQYPVHCAALKPSELVGFDAEHLIETLCSDTDGCFRLLAILSCRLQEKVDQIELLALQNSHLRVAHYLLEEYRRHGTPATFRLDASKKHIARLLAIQPETLSRSLKTLQAEGILDMDARCISIISLDKLEQAARGIVTPCP